MMIVRLSGHPLVQDSLKYHLKEEQKSKQIEDITSLSIQCRLATHDEPERIEK